MDKARYHNRKQRKGAVLLVALFLLAMMLMLGLYYYKVAATFSRSSDARLQAAKQGYDRDQLVNGVLEQVLCGTTNPRSAAYGNGLLEDLYGSDFVTVTAQSVSRLDNGMFQQIRFEGAQLRNHQCDACVVSFRHSSGQIRSGRVVQCLGEEGTLVTEGLLGVQSGDRLLINGYPFNGMSLDGSADGADDSTSQESATDVDEPWDAVDDRNLFLAKLGPEQTIPSFHRPGGPSLRINSDNHPHFASANWQFDSDQGPWDVDNNGDGLPDSVWVDFGLAPIRLPSGIRCKPLVAALIVDLDGRLNVNAHGNAGLVDTKFEPLADLEPAGDTLPQDNILGLGVGPAEINLGAVFQDEPRFSQLLNARQQPFVPNAQQHVGTQPTQPRSGFSNAELSGAQFVYLDKEGQPVHVAIDQGKARNPYATSQLRPRSGARQMFGANDLEWLVRNSEFDETQLATRLRETIAPSMSEMLTSRSVSIPVLPKVGKRGLVETFADRLRARGVDESLVETQLRLMLPPEILRGEKMDLNRPFLVHSQTEEGGSTDRVVNPAPPGSNPGHLVPHRATFSNVDRLQHAKGLYARHLYCMMLGVLPEDAQAETTENLSRQDARRLLAIQVAQWAVNVVDFRDEDGVSTPFEFDTDPWDGWHVNGILKSDRMNESGTKKENLQTRRVVWGMERPELVMTESLALHDRMVGDYDVGGKRKARPGSEPDDDLDQIRQPQGVLLVELKSPHSSQATPDTDPSWPKPIGSTLSAEAGGLYFQHGQSKLPILDLDRTRTGTGNLDYPVWKIAISEWHGQKDSAAASRSAVQMSQRAQDSATLEIDGPTSMLSPNGLQLHADRWIWFTSKKPSEEHPDYGRVYYNQLVAGIWGNKAQLSVGDTAVVTPHFNFSIGQGPRASSDDVDRPGGFHRTKQKFVFTGVGTPQVEFEDETGRLRRTKALPIMATSGSVNTEGEIHPGVGVSVSEPIPLDHSRAYGSASAVSLRDRPSDKHPLAPLSQDALLRSTHTDPDFKTLYLQRLANPNYGWNPLPGHPRYDASLPVNPYLSVDWMPVQLSVYNSAWLPEEIGDWDLADGDFDPSDPKLDDDGFRFGDHLQFSSLEWSGRPHPLDAISKRTLHPTFTPPEFSDFWGAFPYPNRHRIAQPTQQRPPLRLGHTIGTVNTQELLTPAGKRVKLPRPWICWNNRDFANHYELLQVPKSSSSRFRHEFRLPIVDETVGVQADARFGHLLDFASTRLPYHKLLNFVHVPSRYTDAQVNVHPQSQVAGLTYPFGQRSQFRDVGKVNLHTIAHPQIIRALGGRAPEGGEPVSSGSLRDLTKPSDLAGWVKPHETAGMANNPNRNSHFCYLPFSKLANVATNQSNVFAVWLTVGFFELEPNYPQSLDGEADLQQPYFVDVDHPDGLRIGSELDAQGVRRHRVFAIVDRSIPVAVEPGKRHNVLRDTVLLKRTQQ